jgi:hypothetical protein
MICCYNRTRAACSALTKPNFFIRLGHGNFGLHQCTQSKIRAKTAMRGYLERLGEVQAIEPGLLDQELVRAKCVRCPCGIVDGLHCKRSGH